MLAQSVKMGFLLSCPLGFAGTGGCGRDGVALWGMFCCIEIGILCSLYFVAVCLSPARHPLFQPVGFSVSLPESLWIQTHP